ncbi:MAG: hypothetical protein NTV67_06005, partial [Chloroflexi bacterium]|nr:hypothetical protein [Chloroflexota bacterium]
MDEQRRPPRQAPRPVPRQAPRPGVRPGPVGARGWTPRPDGPRHWASKRTIPAQALALVGPDQELIAGRHPVEE